MLGTVDINVCSKLHCFIKYKSNNKSYCELSDFFPCKYTW